MRDEMAARQANATEGRSKCEGRDGMGSRPTPVPCRYPGALTRTKPARLTSADHPAFTFETQLLIGSLHTTSDNTA